MPKFVAPLQDEITRLARKEMTKIQNAFKKTLSTIKEENKILKGKVREMEKAVGSFLKEQGEKMIGPVPSKEEVDSTKVTPKMVIRLRKKFGLSRLKMAALLNLNHKSIARWEQGIGTPQTTSKEKILSLKKMTKREVNAKLKELSGGKTATKKKSTPKKKTAKKAAASTAKKKVAKKTVVKKTTTKKKTAVKKTVAKKVAPAKKKTTTKKTAPKKAAPAKAKKKATKKRTVKAVTPAAAAPAPAEEKK